MDYATAARRIPTLALVVGAHALALAFLLELTRTHLFRAGAEESLTLVDLQPAVQPRPHEPPITAPRANEHRRSVVAPPVGAPAPASRAAQAQARPAPIDWASEGADAAARVAKGDDASRPPRTFGVPPPSAIFASGPAHRPGLAWNHARTHRVEVLPGGVTLFNINDNCAVALLWVVPAFACKLGKIPPRGDLFEHMRDLKDQDGH